jgi:hypothetical protein
MDKRVRKTITRAELQRLAFSNSPRMPQVVNDGGLRKQWVGIGWVTEGPARGTETLVVDARKRGKKR